VSIANRDEGNCRAREVSMRQLMRQAGHGVKGLRRRDRQSRARLRVMVIGNDGHVRLQKIGSKVQGIAIFIVST